jgi:hypothetical protein
MQAMDDMALLREYATSNSEEAFATVVMRQVNLVCSVALRHVGNPHSQKLGLEYYLPSFYAGNNESDA